MNLLPLAPETIAILALGMATLALAMSCMALWPQWKNGFAVLRDGVLWMALVAVLVGAGSMIWRGYRQSVELPDQELAEQSEIPLHLQGPAQSTVYDSTY